MTVATIVRELSSTDRMIVKRPSVKWLRIVGPAFAVGIGYVDPGNWATDIAAGMFGYKLLWVVLLASAIALVLQLAVAEFTVASGTHFSEAIARRWPAARAGLCFAFGAAAVSTDVCEFTGIVLGLQLLLRMPLSIAVITGVAIVFTTLRASDVLVRGLEIGAICALALIACACLDQMAALHPIWHSLAFGAVPSIPGGSIVVLVAIVGATVMPHNLFLHSALVKRTLDTTIGIERRASGIILGRETVAALAIATVVNVALVITGASLGGHAASLQHAFDVFASAGHARALIFGGGLLLSGIAASTTATAAGDGIFAAFSPRPFSRMARRTLTLLPAALLLLSGCNIGALLVWSQVALALILPVALVPLVILVVTSRRAMRHGHSLSWGTAAAACVCVIFDGVMVTQMLFAHHT